MESSITLMIATAALVLLSIALSPRTSTVDGFFGGVSSSGASASLTTLILSQVTTWIFARSLMTAAILGFYYGIAGALAYAAYYLSFVTGGAIVDRLRFKHGHNNVQSFMQARFGGIGVAFYNVVIILRLLSEVFANLIVVGEIFGLKGSGEYFFAIALIGIVTCAYSSRGGLRASLRTDVAQAIIVIALITFLFAAMLGHSSFDMASILNSTQSFDSPGWVLLVVAGLQVWSYPLHDPVMMDRGFIADRKTTNWSFIHAAWISILCIFMFALLGVFAGLNKAEGESMLQVLTRLFGQPLMMTFSLALIASALSTLDSTFSSAAKLVVKDMKWMPESVASGRIVMCAFLVVGALFLLWDSKDLYAAVAVSGTLSMFLLPVIVFCIWGDRDVSTWPLVVTFLVTVLGGVMYVTESSGYTTLMNGLAFNDHKYTKLLIICLVIAVVGFVSFVLGLKPKALRRASEAYKTNQA